MTAYRKKIKLLNIVNGMLVDLPCPSNLSYWWNFGSLLGACMMLQVITGVFVSMHYCSSTLMSFESVVHIMRNVNHGWLIRMLHMNGASLFFVCLYMHMARGVYYGSFQNYLTWTSGVMILLLVMATAFMGYVLPWGQMSFWGATVITNLLSAIPWLGESMVLWVWGGYSVDAPTLTRFFSLHFLLPFLVMVMILIHLSSLHTKGSGNPLGVNSNMDKVQFHPFFSMKDLLGMTIVMMMLTLVITNSPYMFGDSENFIPANPLVTPQHIQPEWYFLFAYAILRSIPNKLGGVLALLASIMIFLVFIFATNSLNLMSSYWITKYLVFYLLVNMMLLTWLGGMPVEDPLIQLGSVCSVMYFIFFILIFVTNNTQDTLLKN